MSLVKTLKAKEDRVKELEAMLVEKDTAIEALTSEKQAAVDAHEALTQTHDALKAEIEAERVRVVESHEAACKEIEDLKKSQEASAEALLKAEGDLAKAKAALADPKFLDAAAVGRTEPVADGGDGDAADGSKLTAPKPEGTPLWDQYDAITDPAQATLFWNENEDGLKAEQRAAWKAGQKAEPAQE
jgi:hypothetical protein